MTHTVKFETITGEEYRLQLNPEITIGQIKAELAENHLFCEMNQIHLLFDGSEFSNESTLKIINLSDGKRFIVIYIEPDGKLPNVNEQIESLQSYNPNPQMCLEALQKCRYNIEAASDYLFERMSTTPDPHPIETNKSTFQSSNKNNNNYSTSNSQTKGMNQQSDGKIVSPTKNPFNY